MSLGAIPMGYLACEHGNLDMVRILVDNGTCVNAKVINRNYTPLEISIFYDREHIVWALLNEFGYDVNDGVSLHTACEHGKLNMVKSLIEHGASVNDKNGHGETPLSVAILHQQDGIALALMTELGCDSNDGISLHMAYNNSDLDMVRTLIEHGAHVNGKGFDGNTPLLSILRLGDVNMVETLIIEHGADVNEKGINSKTPLHVACAQSNLSVVEALINLGADINHKDVDNKTPIYYVIEREEDIKVLESLINHGACFDDTLLIAAVAHGKYEAVKLLVSDDRCDVMYGQIREGHYCI